MLVFCVLLCFLPYLCTYELDSNTRFKFKKGHVIPHSGHTALFQLLLDELESRIRLEHYVVNLETRLSKMEKRCANTAKYNLINRDRMKKTYNKLTEQYKDLKLQQEQQSEELMNYRNITIYLQREIDILKTSAKSDSKWRYPQPSANTGVSLKRSEINSDQDLDGIYKDVISNRQVQDTIEQNVTSKIKIGEDTKSQKKDIRKDEEYISLMAVGLNATSTNPPGTILRFPNIVKSFGIANLTSFKQSGRFSSDRRGLYLISVSVRACTSDQNEAVLTLYKNNLDILNIHVEYSSDPTIKCLTENGVAVIDLSVYDTVYVKTRYVNVTIYDMYSSISIVKLR